MKNYVSLLTAALFLSALPGSISAQTIAGIPPMLETQRPIAMPTSQPAPRAPLPDPPAKPEAAASQRQKAKKSSGKKGATGKAAAATQPMVAKSAKKKGAAPKSRSKVTASRS
jgi:hypothetical protein